MNHLLQTSENRQVYIAMAVACSELAYAIIGGPTIVTKQLARIGATIPIPQRFQDLYTKIVSTYPSI